MRIACPPLTYPCEFLNFSRSRSSLELATHKAVKELENKDNVDMRTGRNSGRLIFRCTPSLDHWDMRTGRNRACWRLKCARESRSLGYAHWPELSARSTVREVESRSLGYAHWPERSFPHGARIHESRSLGYAHWPELRGCSGAGAAESRSLGYAHWPEPSWLQCLKTLSLDHWDMRTGRNLSGGAVDRRNSLDHWDMRTGRNHLRAGRR